jgi:hypothetical protein
MERRHLLRDIEDAPAEATAALARRFAVEAVAASGHAAHPAHSMPAHSMPAHSMPAHSMIVQ